MNRKLTHRIQRHFALAAVAMVTCLAASGLRAQEPAIEERLRALEDESQIRHLLDRYMDVLDAADWDAYVEFFTEDGELVMAEGTRHGREDIKERMAGASARMAANAGDQPRRQSADLLSNIRIRVSGDTATAHSRFTFLGENADGSFSVTGSGLYTDRLERGDDGNWRISSRSVDWDMLRGATRAPD